MDEWTDQIHSSAVFMLTNFLRIFQAVALLGIGDDQNKEPSIDHDELKGQKRPIDAGPYYMNKLTTVSSITTCLYVCTAHECEYKVNGLMFTVRMRSTWIIEMIHI